MTEQQDIVALIPVREGSQRVKGKNFIPFYEGESLLEIKINALKKADCFDHNLCFQLIKTESGIAL